MIIKDIELAKASAHKRHKEHKELLDKTIKQIFKNRGSELRWKILNH